MGKYNLNKHPKVKKILRRGGLTLVIIGLILDLVALIDFFSPGFPTVFYLFFIGTPMLLVGFVMLSYGYYKEIARYQASQIAPVAKDTVNYMLDGTKASAGEFFEQLKNTPLPSKTCPQCGKEIFPDAMYCDNCGCAMFKKCSNCQTINQVNSKFCQGCGKSLT